MSETPVSPAPPEAEKPRVKELLGRENVGLQARALLGEFTPGSTLTLDKTMFAAIQKDGVDGIDPKVQKDYEHASLVQRKRYEEENGQTYEKWEKGFNTWLSEIRNDTDHPERAQFLQTIGFDDTDGAKEFYDYFLNEESDVINLVVNIEENASREQIIEHADIIRSLGNTFGYESSEMIEHLIHGVRNVRDDVDGFVEAANGSVNSDEVITSPLLQKLQTDLKEPLSVKQTSPPSEPGVTEGERHPTRAIRIGGESAPGNKGENQDAIWFDEKIGAAVLCDGMGGAGDGARAAQTVRNSMAESFKKMPQFATSQEAQQWLRDQINRANQTVADEKAKQDKPMASDAGTTLTVAFVWTGPNDERELITGNIGDSRLSIIRNGKLEDLTIDQSHSGYHLVRDPNNPDEFAQIGGFPYIDKSRPRSPEEIQALQERFSTISDPNELTKEEAAYWDIRNRILFALDGQPLGDAIEIGSLDLLPGDRIIGRSDGLTDVTKNVDTLEVLMQHENSQDAARALIEKAKQDDRGPRKKSYSDDKSAFVMDIKNDTTPQKGSRGQEEAERKPASEGPIPAETQVETEEGTFIVQRSDGENVYGTIVTKEMDKKDMPLRDFYQAFAGLAYDKFKAEKKPEKKVEQIADTKLQQEAGITEQEQMKQGLTGMAGVLIAKKDSMTDTNKRTNYLSRLLKMKFVDLPSDLMNLVKYQPDKSVEEVLSEAGIPFAVGHTFETQGITHVITDINPETGKITYGGPVEVIQKTMEEFENMKTKSEAESTSATTSPIEPEAGTTPQATPSQPEAESTI